MMSFGGVCMKKMRKSIPVLLNMQNRKVMALNWTMLKE